MFLSPLLLAGAVWAAPAAEVPLRLPSTAQLTRAASRKDEVELSRAAARLGPLRLLRLAARGTSEERAAALQALPHAPNAWAMLEALADLARAAAGLAERAGEAARRIAESLGPEVLEAGDAPRDVLAAAGKALLRAAADGRLPAAARAAFVEALGALRPWAPPDDAALAGLLSADEVVARAAAEVLGDAPREAPRLEKLLESGAPPGVAAAAAAALCRDVPPVANPAHPAEKRAQRLSPAARATLRRLAVDEKVPLLDRLDLLGCLRVGGDPADKKVLDDLARKGGRTLKARARALGGR